MSVSGVFGEFGGPGWLILRGVLVRPPGLFGAGLSDLVRSTVGLVRVDFGFATSFGFLPIQTCAV